MPKELLIADPNVTAQEEFEGIFEGTDSQLIFAENGEDALLKIKLYKPDLVIADVTMPNKDGFELCKIVKANSELRGIPFVLLAGIFEDIDKSEREKVGADGVITKPLKADQILPLVKTLIKAGPIPLQVEETGDKEAEGTPAEESLPSMDELPPIESLEEIELAAAEGVDEAQLPAGEDEGKIIELTDVVEEETPGTVSGGDRVNDVPLEQVAVEQGDLPEETVLDEKALEELDLDEPDGKLELGELQLEGEGIPEEAESAPREAETDLIEELEIEESEEDLPVQEGEARPSEEPVTAELEEEIDQPIDLTIEEGPREEGDTLLELEDVELEDVDVHEEEVGVPEEAATDLIEELEIEESEEDQPAQEGGERPSEETVRAELEEEIDEHIDLVLEEQEEEEDTILELEGEEELDARAGREDLETATEEIGLAERPADAGRGEEASGDEGETILELTETEELEQTIEDEGLPEKSSDKTEDEPDKTRLEPPRPAPGPEETLGEVDRSSSESIEALSGDLDELSMEGLEDLGEAVEELEEFPFEEELDGLPGVESQEGEGEKGVAGENVEEERDLESAYEPPGEGDLETEERLEKVFVDDAVTEETRGELTQELPEEGLEETEESVGQPHEESDAASPKPPEVGPYPGELIKEEHVSEEEIAAFQKSLSTDHDASELEVKTAAGVSDERVEALVREAVEEVLKNVSESVIPELSRAILQVASERIEKVVQEVVPELAEGAIKKEIEKLQKGS
ncbi:MAG: response regulator [Proteobacteria bacterium]|nr:response regulator [Pseudomonadota bacterium]